jgi:UDP-glucuronate 4-epimerase
MTHNSATPTVLVTGAKGCIGAWTVRALVEAGYKAISLDLPDNMYRLEIVLGDLLEQVKLLDADILDLTALIKAVEGNGVTHIVHLAGLQVPTCRAKPTLGAQVNVVGTVNVFEAARHTGIKHIVYASSIAAYSPEMTLEPRTLYGVWKLANEGTARVYNIEHGISSIGLRPYVVYGLGRDFGMTSGTTLAMLAAAAGKNYHVPFGGTALYHLGRDCGQMFMKAALATDFGKAEVFDMPGNEVHMSQIAAAIEAAAPGVAITFENNPLPFPHHYEKHLLAEAIGEIEITPIEEGVAQTIDDFRRELAAGRVPIPD